MAIPLSLKEIRSKMRASVEEMNKKTTERFKKECGDDTINFINKCLQNQKEPIMERLLPECADKFYEHPNVVEKFLQQAYPDVVESVKVHEYKESHLRWFGNERNQIYYLTKYRLEVRFDLSK
jgi:hypothetical protein